jgi:hypothetical protein
MLFVTIFIYLPLALAVAAMVGLAIARMTGHSFSELKEMLRSRLEGRYKPMPTTDDENQQFDQPESV